MHPPNPLRERWGLGTRLPGPGRPAREGGHAPPEAVNLITPKHVSIRVIAKTDRIHERTLASLGEYELKFVELRPHDERSDLVPRCCRNRLATTRSTGEFSTCESHVIHGRT